MARKIDLTNQRFGRLLVIKQGPATKQQRARWWCLCACGTGALVGHKNLCSGHAKSCGCLRLERRKAPGEATKNILWSAYQRSAETRGYAWDLQEPEFRALIAQVCLYCGSAPTNVRTSSNQRTSPEWRAASILYYQGIDRLHNHLGYSTSNCVPCCKSCNSDLRSDLPLDVWLFWLKRRQPERYLLILETVIKQLGPNWEQEVQDERSAS